MKFAYAVTTWSSPFLKTTLEHIPENSRVLIVDNRKNGWSLARGWNYAADKLLWDEAYDAIIIMNDDVVLRPDTGELLVAGLLYHQYHPGLYFEDQWPPNRPELLLLSGRHASWSDACTDAPDEEMLANAETVWQPGPDFSCFCITRKLGQVIGRFDEFYNPAYFEDNDTHRRIQLAGYEAGAFAPYWHFRNGTIRTDPERASMIQASFEDSKRYYCKKWGAPFDNDSPIGRETFLTPFNR